MKIKIALTDDYDSSSSEDYRSAEEDDAIFNNELDSIISGFKNVHILTPKGMYYNKHTENF